MKFTLTAIVLFNCLFAGAQTISLIKATNARTVAVDETLKNNFKSYTILKLANVTDVFNKKTTEITLDIQGSSAVTFKGMHNATLLNGTDIIAGNKKSQPSDILHFNGNSSDNKNRLSLSVSDGFVMGAYYIGNDVFYIEPLKHFIPTAAADEMIFYKGTEVVTKDVSCGVSTTTLQQQIEQRNQQNNNPLGSERLVELAIGVDYTTFAFHGSSADETMKYISTVINMVQDLYNNQFNDQMNFTITEFVISTPWQATSDISNNYTTFSSWAVTGFTKPYDLSSFWFYTQNFTSGVVGLAGVPSTCNNRGNNAIREYGAPISRMQLIVGHEFAHNFNSTHDGSGGYIMSPTVGGTEWSLESKVLINNWLTDPATACMTAPEVTITTDQSGAICKDANVKFTASANATVGSNPTYQWKLNNKIVGTNSATYQNAGLSTGDMISCEISSTLSNKLVRYNSKNLIIEIANEAAPTVTIQGQSTFCEGKTVKFVALGGGTFQWYKDGVAMQDSTSNTIIVGKSGSYSVKSVIAGCSSSQSTAWAVTVNPVPAAPSISIVDNALKSSEAQGNQWYLNNVAIAGATSQTYTPTTNGVYNVGVTLAGCSSALSANFNYITTSINSPALQKAIIIAPNPVADILYISYSNNTHKMKVLLMDITGRNVLAEGSFTSTYRFNMSGYASGSYLVKITDEKTGDQLTKQIIKK